MMGTKAYSTVQPDSDLILCSWIIRREEPEVQLLCIILVRGNWKQASV